MRKFLFLLIPLALVGCGAAPLDATAAHSRASACSEGSDCADGYVCLSDSGSDAGVCARRVHADSECGANEEFVSGQSGLVEGVCAPRATTGDVQVLDKPIYCMCCTPTGGGGYRCNRIPCETRCG